MYEEKVFFLEKLCTIEINSVPLHRFSEGVGRPCAPVFPCDGELITTI